MRRIPSRSYMIKDDDKWFDYEAITYEGKIVKGGTLGSSEESVREDLRDHQYQVRWVSEIMNHNDLINYINRITRYTN